VKAIKGCALVLAVLLAGEFVAASSTESHTATTTLVRLKAISSRVTSNGTSLVIEASEPVPYVATRPDPLTLYIDFRNVASDGLASLVSPTGKGPIERVAVEPADPVGEGSPRIRVKLTEPVAHHVRSDRNTVVIDFDRTPAKSAVAGTRVVEAAPRPAAAAQGNAGQAAAPPPQAPTQPETTARPGGPRRFSGNPVSLDFQGADLRAVLRTFSEISSLNIVIDPAVNGSVDVALKDVPWDQALDIILRANKLGYIVDGTIVRIAPLTVLAEEETQRRKLTDEQALAGEIRVFTKTLSYALAEEVKPLLLKSALSSRGNVEVDKRTNTLIITDLAERLTTANDLLNSLDRAQPQVEIEARIVQVNKNFQRALGVKWGFNGIASPELGNTTVLGFPNNGTISGAQGGSTNGIPTAVNLPANAPNSGIGLQLGSVNGSFNLDVALTALETTGNGRVLSTPRVSTQNNVEAEIKQGTQIPIQTVANNTVTVSFKDAALVLKVTPQITAANTVIMKISLENGQADFTKAVNGIPPINTQSANTSVLVNDGQTTVIGGIYLSSEQYQTDRTPGLGRIPILNWLFKRETALDNSTELLIFITPRIVKT
jgi:type IV pilus assembly protein PilQ